VLVGVDDVQPGVGEEAADPRDQPRAVGAGEKQAGGWLVGHGRDSGGWRSSSTPAAAFLVLQRISQTGRRAVAPAQLQVFVPRLLIKSKHSLPLAAGAAAAAVVFVLLAAGASAHTGPRIALGYAEPVQLPQLHRPALHFQRVVRTLAEEIRVAERERERRAAEAAARERREEFEDLPGGVSIETLEAIASCESGGDPTAVSSDGTYRGMYQFDFGTWESVGGEGDPAAASAAEQSYRAALLYSRSGSSPWPVCG
jgi:hypothetical protein